MNNERVALMQEAMKCLIGGFGAVIEETFKPSVIISSESNQFASFSKPEQQQIVNSAFAKGVAQNLAAIFVQYPQVQQIEIYNGFMTMLKHETDQYHKEFLALIEVKNKPVIGEV